MHKKLMMQIFRTVVTLVLMVLMACSIFSLRKQLAESKAELAEARESLKLAQKQVELDRLQIEMLTEYYLQPPEPDAGDLPPAPVPAEDK